MLSRSHAVNAPVWSTSTFRGQDGPAGEQRALSEHLQRCHRAQGPWHPLHAAADVMDGLVAGRLMTTIVIASLMIGLAACLG